MLQTRALTGLMVLGLSLLATVPSYAIPVDYVITSGALNGSTFTYDESTGHQTSYQFVNWNLNFSLMTPIQGAAPVNIFTGYIFGDQTPIGALTCNGSGSCSNPQEIAFQATTANRSWNYDLNIGNPFFQSYTAFLQDANDHSVFVSTTGNFAVAPVPLPAAAVLFGAGLIGLVGWQRKRLSKMV